MDNDKPTATQRSETPGADKKKKEKKTPQRSGGRSVAGGKPGSDTKRAGAQGRRAGGGGGAGGGAGGKPKRSRLPRIPGLEVREVAVALLGEVLDNGRTFNEARLAAFGAASVGSLSDSDKGFARAISATVLRLKRVLDDIIDAHLERALPAKYRAVRLVLLSASAQLLILKTPPHAAINLAVEQTRRLARVTHLAGLVNAVLRKVARNGPDILARTDIAQRSVPDWLWARWVKAYGEQTAHSIAKASLAEPALDITIKPGVEDSTPDDWAQRLDGVVLCTGSVRKRGGGRVEQLTGFNDGAWWVQDVAAALPARLLGEVNGVTVADICAAPGGKSAQLAAAGAKVIAVDIDSNRLERVRENISRVGLGAELVAADVLTWSPGRKFDFILVDAPCTSTGTIRRHPDILHLKREQDVGALAARQMKILNSAFALLETGGTLVYCSCSLEPEEGETLVSEFLQTTLGAELSPIIAGEAGIKPEWLSQNGMLRTLPSFDPLDASGKTSAGISGGMDGFFAARIVRAD